MKNFIVALGPIVVVTPERNMRLPMANKARSKKRKTPRVVKPHPNAISPMPISIIITSIIINERYNMCCQRNNGEREW